MASRIQPKEATLATTAVACLIATMAVILIGSIYLTNGQGWPNLVLNVFSALAVCAVSVSALAYAAYEQYVAKRDLFTDYDRNEIVYRSTGQWAVVTGATDGIGKEYARQLAVDYGMDVLLVGRNPNKLKTVAELIRKECAGDRRVMTVVADFVEDPIARGGLACHGAAMKQDEDDDNVGDACFCDSPESPSIAVRRRCTRWYPRLRAVTDKISRTGGGVGVLINCAGVCYPYPEYFAGMLGHGHGPVEREFTTEFCDSADAAVRCNVAAAVHTSRLVLPGMLARGRGLIVNVGSALASVPAAPLMTLYAATKKFLEKLSADLDTECAYLTRKRADEDGGHGVRVQCVGPAYVATAMLRSANPNVRRVPDDGDEHADGCWWTNRRRHLANRVERWLVPSARRWVRSALRQSGRSYAAGDGPVNITGYWPHTLLVWCTRLASTLMPGQWFTDHVLMPGMLEYREKGRKAIRGEKEMFY